jgi:hypothetical protein
MRWKQKENGSPAHVLLQRTTATPKVEENPSGFLPDFHLGDYATGMAQTQAFPCSAPALSGDMQ